MKTMEQYERELSELAPLELMYRYEELTIALAANAGQLGDYHRQMLCKRVMLRKMAGTTEYQFVHTQAADFLKNFKPE